MTKSRPDFSALVLSCALGGCSSGSPAPEQPAATHAGVIDASTPPSDFTLALTVYGPEPAPGRAARAAAARQAQYVMEADRVLRVAIGDGAGETTFPAQTRRLSPQEVARLWSEVAGAGWLAAAAPPTPAADAPRAARISVSGEGRRRTIILPPGDASARRVLDRLSEWGFTKP